MDDLEIPEGTRLHEGALLEFLSGVDSLLDEAIGKRGELVKLADDDIADIHKKRQVLADVEARTERLRHYADLVVGAALASSGRQTLWLVAARTADDAAIADADEAVQEQARKWLVTDQPDGGFKRQPLHWPLVFPEVFDENRPFGPGFDAIIGNPPFLGGQKLT